LFISRHHCQPFSDHLSLQYDYDTPYLQRDFVTPM